MRRMFFILFSPNEQRRGGDGGGVRCQTLYFVPFFLSSRPRAGLATNTLNVRNKTITTTTFVHVHWFIVPTNKVVSVKHTVLRCLFSVLIYIYPVRLIMSIL